MTLNKHRGCLEKVTCLKYVILPWLLARLRPYAGFLSIIFFLCNAEDSSYEPSPDEWYVIRPFITQKLAPLVCQRKFALLLRYGVNPLRYNAHTLTTFFLLSQLSRRKLSNFQLGNRGRTQKDYTPLHYSVNRMTEIEIRFAD